MSGMDEFEKKKTIIVSILVIITFIATGIFLASKVL